MIAPAAQVEQTLRQSLDQAGVLQAARPRLVLAVSGGLDSMVLAHVLVALRAHSNPDSPPPFDLQIAHFDHALRLGSAADAKFVAQQAATWGLPFASARWEMGDARGRSGSLEADARTARYAFLAEVVRSAQAGEPGRLCLLVTAHHADDQAETLLINLLRGTGVAGLAGMRPLAPLPGAPDLSLLRPLLSLPRAVLHAAALEREIEWREDETNQSTTYTRNLLRHDVLPLLESAFPGARDRLVRTASLLADEADRLARATEAHLAALTRVFQPGERLQLDAAGLAALPAADRRAVLHLALAQIGVGEDGPDFATAAALGESLAPGSDFSAHGPHSLPNGLLWTLLPGSAEQPARLSLHREDALPAAAPGPWLDSEWCTAVSSTALAPNHSLQVGDWRLYIRLEPPERFPGAAAVPPLEAWLDAAVGPLSLRAPLPGDRIEPLGMGGQSKAVGDLFTDRKIPPALRAGWPLICTEAGAVVWVCGLAVSHRAAVTPGARELIHLRWLSADDPALSQPRVTPPRAYVKPLMHWAINKRYKLRFSRREPDAVEGLVNPATDPVPFSYDPGTRTLTLDPGAPSERTAQLSEYGWETGRETTATSGE